MSVDALVDSEALREEVRRKCRQVALAPDTTFHFHTGRPRHRPDAASAFGASRRPGDPALDSDQYGWPAGTMFPVCGVLLD